MYLRQNPRSFKVIKTVGCDTQTVVSSASAGHCEGYMGCVLQKAEHSAVCKQNNLPASTQLTGYTH